MAAWGGAEGTRAGVITGPAIVDIAGKIHTAIVAIGRTRIASNSASAADASWIRVKARGTYMVTSSAVVRVLLQQRHRIFTPVRDKRIAVNIAAVANDSTNTVRTGGFIRVGVRWTNRAARSAVFPVRQKVCLTSISGVHIAVSPAAVARSPTGAINAGCMRVVRAGRTDIATQAAVAQIIGE